MDGAYTHLMVFSGDTLSDPDRRRRGLAVEPMTGAPDMLHNGFGRLVNHFEEYRERTLGEIERVAAFARELPKGVKLAIAPEIEAGVRDLAALSRVAGYVTSGTGILKRLEASAREVESGG